MAKKSSKQRRKARQRKAERRKRKRVHVRSRQLSPLSRPAGLRTASEWPLMECLLTKSWQEPGEIIQILVARRGPHGQVAAGTFLVDLGCLGVKDAFARLFESRHEYGQLRRQMQSHQHMTSADLNLVASILREGMAYADQFGFKPHRDYYKAKVVLGNADPDACDVPIPLGMDGKPFYIAGPYDNAERIIAKLTRKLGPDGFHYVVPMGGDDIFFADD